MLKNIKNLQDAKAVTKKEQKQINGGWGSWPRTESECINCGGNWYPIPFPAGGLCELPVNSPCA
ncbi:MAG: hypothetical protein AAFQ94_00145 [Bacteroidota bacterium]